MPSKSDLQALLKDRYGINKNVSQALSPEDCEQLLSLLRDRPAARGLVAAFIQKNNELSNNNRALGQRRSQAEKRLERLTQDCQRLEAAVAKQEERNQNLAHYKEELAQEESELQRKIEALNQQNQALASKVQTLTTRNDELIDANERLQKDNKALKNILDQIRLRLARDIDELLRYEDSELRKAMIRVLRWTLG
ncbi:hypothetical protein GFS31_29110 [Leptolyngbya sp. BL0902]|uniref:hypothetical protein n=1 Tax=Leptolyngbya sp. BL0902 TaxID=1115757 RepID=UPI0018E72647|nr:hypothetical protein [Leptolyngbya sp. BL0902]QQE66213.1 hypothetical protein GFS31_29110 [Leptolyngbya sp. BL0902]